MSKWVQSKYSKDAKKWEVVHIKDAHLPVAWPYWKVRDEDGIFKELLKSEYRECNPPEQWATCTRDVVEIHNELTGSYLFNRILVTSSKAADGTRWAWSYRDPDALVIQRKVS